MAGDLDPLPTCTIRVHRLDPMCAELRLEFTGLPADVEVRGRLIGPRCPGVTTVEVAYPVQAFKHPIYRVVIPDPIRWSAEQPFVYEGPMQFLRAGQVVGTTVLSCGVKAGV